MDGPFGPGLAGLVGRPLEEVRGRLGPPDVEREVGGDRWLMYERGELSVRIRCRPAAAARPAEGFRLASWTASFREPRATLREAADALGLWPASAPDADARSAKDPLLRREVRVGALGPLTLTARVRGGRVDQITLFDEEPEWDRTGP